MQSKLVSPPPLDVGCPSVVLEEAHRITVEEVATGRSQVLKEKSRLLKERLSGPQVQSDKADSQVLLPMPRVPLFVESPVTKPARMEAASSSPGILQAQVEVPLRTSPLLQRRRVARFMTGQVHWQHWRKSWPSPHTCAGLACWGPGNHWQSQCPCLLRSFLERTRIGTRLQCSGNVSCKCAPKSRQ